MDIKRREFLAGIAAVGGASLFESSVRARTRAASYSAPVIDAHAHWYPPEFTNLMVKEGQANGAKMTGPNADGDWTAAVPGGQWYTPGGSTFRREMWDIEIVIKQMDDRGVDMYALSMTHPMVYWAPPEFGLRLSQAANNATSAMTIKYPKRFVGTIMLPLQDPELAVMELERAAKLPGMRAINMGEHVNGKNLCDESLWPVWERCEKFGLPLFLHNLNPTDHERLVEKKFSMINVLGNPFEAGIAAEALVLGGVMDAFPKLDVYLPHAGGTFPWMVWRTDFAQKNNGDFKYMKQPASSYLRRFHYDLIMHNPKLLRILIDMVGADRIVSGTDFPQGMSVRRPVELVESLPGITQRERELILCENPARLLKL
jgi:aminocarboxymuconate-semialdehyde decarboxylase